MSLMAESGCLEQVDRGADNPTSYYKTIMKPVKGGQGLVWAVAPLIIINIKRINWSLGVVMEVYPGKDGIPRMAKVKTAEGMRTRPFQCL
jgi:hypothetical protein